jgi:hypothetical protein
MIDRVLTLDFGSQYTQLIGRCVRETGVALELNNAPLNRRDKGDDRDGASAWRVYSTARPGRPEKGRRVKKGRPGQGTPRLYPGR